MLEADEEGPALRVGALFVADGGATVTFTWPCTVPPWPSEIVTFKVKVVVVATVGEIQEGLDVKRLLKEPTGVAGSCTQE
jgi:hypothetical protein